MLKLGVLNSEDPNSRDCGAEDDAEVLGEGDEALVRVARTCGGGGLDGCEDLQLHAEVLESLRTFEESSLQLWVLTLRHETLNVVVEGVDEASDGACGDEELLPFSLLDGSGEFGELHSDVGSVHTGHWIVRQRCAALLYRLCDSHD